VPAILTDNGRSILAGTLALVLFVSLLPLYSWMQTTDSQLALLINADRGAWFTVVMVAASRYGRDYFWVGVVALMLIFGTKKTKLDAIELAMLFAVGIFAGEVLKQLVYEPRPFEVLQSIVLRVPEQHDSSFPSGHALIVGVGATFALVKFRKKSIAIMLALEAAVVAYSRIYVGMHFPLDVIAGICLGVAIVLLGFSFLDQRIEDLLTKFAQLVRSANRIVNSRWSVGKDPE
jgi:membrane-associated phospholipid phosphatase